MVCPAQRLETVPAARLPVDSSLPECDCLFLIMFRQIAETVLRKKNYKKDYFLMGQLRIESSPDISLPPCIGA